MRPASWAECVPDGPFARACPTRRSPRRFKRRSCSARPGFAPGFSPLDPRALQAAPRGRPAALETGAGALAIAVAFCWRGPVSPGDFCCCRSRSTALCLGSTRSAGCCSGPRSRSVLQSVSRGFWYRARLRRGTRARHAAAPGNRHSCACAAGLSCGTGDKAAPRPWVAWVGRHAPVARPCTDRA